MLLQNALKPVTIKRINILPSTALQLRGCKMALALQHMSTQLFVSHLSIKLKPKPGDVGL